jgi:hypothetical protein
VAAVYLEALVGLEILLRHLQMEEMERHQILNKEEVVGAVLQAPLIMAVAVEEDQILQLAQERTEQAQATVTAALEQRPPYQDHL